MGKMIIVTPTYNHAHLLNTLYKSLLKQSYDDFEWMIINDGSIDDTDRVIREFLEDGKLCIQYIEKENGGKSSALNMAFEKIKEEDFIIIVDDDEFLYDNALEIVNQTRSVYVGDTSIGMILFNRIDKTTGKAIADPMPTENIILDYYEWKKKYYFDGYLAYMGYAIKDKKFPIYEGEKYIAPSIMMMLVTREYKMVVSKETIGETEYQEGGITKQGRELRLKNPIGGMYYCFLLQDKRASLKLRIKYSLLGYSYFYYTGKDKKEFSTMGIDINKFQRLMRFPGFVLSKFWSKGGYRLLKR